MTKPDRSKEIQRNFEFFQRELPKILEQYRGKYALIHNQIISGYYDTVSDAVMAGNSMYNDKLFSVQQVTDASIDLGFYSHALPVGNAQ